MSHGILGRLAVLAAASAFSWLPLSADDSVVGTWVLDVQKSLYLPGPPPKSQTRVYRESSNGITATVVTVGADGKATTVEYPVNYDGQAYTVSGSTDIDAIQVKRLTSDRSESTMLHAGRVFAKAVREVSADGKKLTITYQGVLPDGTAVKNVSRYDKR